MKNITLLTFLLFTIYVTAQNNAEDSELNNPFSTLVRKDVPISYTNPIIPGFYSDPSVCRVNDDYYLITSTFEYFPGVPVFHSKDLVNWEQIGHCIDREEQLPNGINIFAATIRHHDGIFYMITTNVGNGGNFYVTATNPSGPWSNPVWLNDLGGIDPDLFWDDDGKSYVIASPMILYEIDLSTGKLVSEGRKIWNGAGGRYAEGPHLYKKDGYYYLMAAEGGTEEAHSETIARSHHIWGPYIDNPSNPILAHANAAGQGLPIQGVGHADIVEAHDGSWWIVFHGYRDVVGYPVHHILGRETCLAPVSWPVNGWPVVNGNGTAQSEMRVPTLPAKPFPQKPDRINFDSELDLEWNYIQSPNSNNYELNTKKGILSLTGSASQISSIWNINQEDKPTFIGKRINNYNFTATTQMDFMPKNDNEEAGLILLNNGSHFDIVVSKKEGQRYLVVKLQFGPTIYQSKEYPLTKDPVYLRITGKKDKWEFAFSQNGNNYTTVETADARFLSSQTVGWFTGVYVGLYATGNGKKCESNANFDWFEYKINKE